MDYYEILQVHPKADGEAITAAYERLRGRYEPARLEGAAEELVELARRRRDDIERSYAVLSDPVRRAAYDEEQQALQPVAVESIPLPNGAVGVRQGGATNGAAEEMLDYSPLPPARRQERAKSFDTQPVVTRRSSISSAPARQSGRAAGPTTAPRPVWVMPIGVIAGLVVVVAIITSVATSYGQQGTDTRTSAQQAAAGTAQAALDPSSVVPSADQVINQFEPQIATAQQAVKTNAQSADAWINLGNLLFDSVQVVRENQPGSDLYQQRLQRWLDASDAYEKALAITPNNPTVRADMAVSLCYYGSDRGDQSYVTRGMTQAQQAIQQSPTEARVLFDMGVCQVSTQPPQTDAALKNWQQVAAMSDKEPALATQAQRMIDLYGKK